MVVEFINRMSFSLPPGKSACIELYKAISFMEIVDGYLDA